MTTTHPARREYLTKAETIVRELRESIVNGVLLPGSPLSLDALALEFGVSAIPVREALRTLEAEGLAVVEPHKVAAVAPLPIDELEDIYRVRMMIEAEATRQGVPMVTTEVIARLQELISHDVDHDLAQGARHHRAFHMEIYRTAGSPTLLEIISTLWDKTERCRMVLRSAVMHPPEKLATHHAHLVELIALGDPDKAADAVRLHIHSSTNQLHELIASTRSIDSAGKG